MGELISANLYQALKVAQVVNEECRPEGPTTLALELVNKHRALLDSVTDEEIIRLSALVQALERGKLFKAAATQEAAGGPDDYLRSVGTLLGVHPTPTRKEGS